MRIGQFDRIVIFQSPAPASDGAGQPIITWTDQTPAWAQLLKVDPSEGVLASAEVTPVRVVYRLRYNAAVNATWRAKVGTTVYAVTGVTPVGRDRYMDVAMTTGAGT